MSFLPEERNDTLIMMIIALTLGSGGLVMWRLDETARYQTAGFFALLGAKLRREEILDNEKRGMIRGYLAANPGANFASILHDLEMATGTLSYHVRVMQKENLIRSWRDGRFRRFALAGHPMAEIRPILTDVELIMLQDLHDNPGLTQTELARMMGLGQPTTSYHVRKLAALGLVTSVREGFRKRYFADLGRGTTKGEQA